MKISRRIEKTVAGKVFEVTSMKGSSTPQRNKKNEICDEIKKGSLAQ